ncbi:unnamed protein product [Rhizophagus irregularis]|nr:unnamed protein product [Rhizophagus irregularis]
MGKKKSIFSVIQTFCNKLSITRIIFWRLFGSLDIGFLTAWTYRILVRKRPWFFHIFRQVWTCRIGNQL